MIEPSYELSSEEVRSVTDLYRGQTNATVLQHPLWPIQTDDSQRVRHFIHKKDAEVLAYAKVVESRSRKAPFLKFASLIGSPLSVNLNALIDLLKEMSEHYHSSSFAELEITLRCLDLQFAELVTQSLVKSKAGLYVQVKPDVKSTLVLPLNDDLDKISSQFSTNLKRNIKKGLKADVVIRELEPGKDLLDFQKIYDRMKAERGVNLYKTEFLKEIYGFIQETGLGSVLAAFHEDVMIGGMILIYHGDRAEYLIGGTDPLSKNLPQAHLTFLEAIKSVKNRGLEFFDFGGFGFNAEEGSQVFNINRFKLGFSKDIRFYPKAISVRGPRTRYLAGEILKNLTA